jgi:hypothetical protein
MSVIAPGTRPLPVRGPGRGAIDDLTAPPGRLIRE